MSTPTLTAKDLSKEAPRSPRVRLGGYALLARAIDKGRADIAGTAGEYHFDCPLDNYLFSFKGVKGSDVRTLLEKGATDVEVAAWLDTQGTPKTAAEVKEWSDGFEATKPYEIPDKKEWFVEACAAVGIDPAKSTLSDYLETDDRKSFAK